MKIHAKGRNARSRFHDRLSIVRADLRRLVEDGLRAGYQFDGEDLRAFNAINDRLYEMEKKHNDVL